MRIGQQPFQSTESKINVKPLHIRVIRVGCLLSLGHAVAPIPGGGPGGGPSGGAPSGGAPIGGAIIGGAIIGGAPIGGGAGGGGAGGGGPVPAGGGPSGGGPMPGPCIMYGLKFGLASSVKRALVGGTAGRGGPGGGRRNGVARRAADAGAPGGGACRLAPRVNSRDHGHTTIPWL